MEMYKCFISFTFIFTILHIFKAVDSEEVSTGSALEMEASDKNSVKIYETTEMEKAIRDFEKTANSAEEYVIRDNHGDVLQEFYSKMATSVSNFIEVVKTGDTAYAFLKAKGLERVVLVNLHKNYHKLRKNLLILTKALFEKAPKATMAYAHTDLLDKLLDIFTDDDNLANKAYTLDILNIWLPNNPDKQLRVMKMKGLEPFYDHMTTLDASSIRILLSLFNKILMEHVKARDETVQRYKEDNNKNIMYQRIGLLERMSTLESCRGLLHVFRTTLAFSNDDNNMIRPIFDLVLNIRPFCEKYFKASPKAIEFFKDLHNFVNNPEKLEYFSKHNLDIDKLNHVIKDHTKGEKDEF